MAVRSMTGFGRASVEVGGRRHVVEVRSLNGRGLDVKVRARAVAAAFEGEAVRAVRRIAERGSVQITIEPEAAPESPVWDPARVHALHAALVRTSHELGIPGPIDLMAVAAWWGIAGAERGRDLGWHDLGEGVVQALADLLAMRRREGQALEVELRALLAGLATIRSRVGALAGDLPGRFAQRLQERVAALAPNVALEPGRMAQEIALLAERLDVAEELARLDAHIGQFEDALSGDDGSGGVGRRLEFLVQELGREINTIGAKAQDAAVAAQVIEAKVTLEKIREQVQNVE